MSYNNNQLGNNIKKALRIRNKTQKWLAKKLGVTAQHVNKWCQNKNEPSPKYLLKISEILDFNIEEIQTGNFKDLAFKTYSPNQSESAGLIELERKSIRMILNELEKNNLTKQKKKAYKTSIINKIDLIIDLLTE